MSATLEASIMMVDVETAEEIPPESQSPGPKGKFSPTTFAGTESLFDGDSFADPRAIPSLRGSFFHAPPGPTAPLEANAAAPAQPWPSPPPEIPPSPGTALIMEFDALYQKYGRRVYRQCYRMLGNQEDAEDLTQEVFLQLFRKAHTFRGESNFSTWLHRLTLNTVLMQMRRFRRWRESVTSLDAPPAAEDGARDVLRMVNAHQAPATATLDKISLDIAIGQLSSGYQEIFLLHDVKGYRHEEIAKLLGISEGTSKSQLHKARLRLRTFIDSARVGRCHRKPARPGPRTMRCPSPREEQCVLA